ncbi:MAG: PAS domain-containing protein [Alphaproteobacteria bacterium]|nr:PAS domain-containing protein [Alphaproteobacteria bacterium]
MQAILQSVLDALPEPVLLVGADGSVVAANVSFTRRFGEAKTNLLQLIAMPADRAAAFLRRCAAGERLSEQLDFALPEGGSASMRVEATPLCAAGTLLLRCGLPDASDSSEDGAAELARLRDANRQLQAEIEERARELSVSRARLRLFFDVSPDWLTMQRITTDGRILYEDLNPTTEAAYGLPRSEVIGRSVEEVLGTEQAQIPLHHLRECLRSGEMQRYTARRLMAGVTRTIDVVMVPVPAHPGETDRYVITTARDLTEREQLEEELRHAQKMEALGHLTGGVAHDFNNLLTVIMGNIERLQSLLPEGESGPIARAAGNVLHGAERGAELTQRLLAFSRRQPLEPKPTDLNQLMSHITELLRSTLGASIAIETVMQPQLWLASVDPNQFENAAVNLAVNARDAMPEGGRLLIETANLSVPGVAASPVEVEEGEYVAIAFSDTGHGMAPEVLERVFEPFFTTKPTGQGTGLGLSQVYGFVKQSGGNIRIHSKVGFGTTVKIFLPRLRDSAAAAPAQAEAGQIRGQGHETVLVVEDDDNVRELSLELLRELGYNVLEAADAPAALQLIERQPGIDLLFTDIGLPGMNGRQLAEEARRRRPELKVLFTSGYANPALVHGGRLDPGVQIIVKPFTYAGLSAKLRAVLEAAP